MMIIALSLLIIFLVFALLALVFYDTYLASKKKHRSIPRKKVPRNPPNKNPPDDNGIYE